MPVIDSRRTPRPLRAGIGIAAQASLRAFEMLARARERAERTYEEMANRGETVIARWRGEPEPRQTPPKYIDLDAEPSAPPLPHDELPLDDYDHLTLGSLRARLPKLDPVELRQIQDYERAHGNRAPVLTLIESRLAKARS